MSQALLFIDQLKPSDQIGQLFISVNGCEQIKNSLLHLGYVLKNINPKYKNTGHIRQSVITEWLKEKDLRTVQYMAGHRYVSSTERYQTSNLEDFKGCAEETPSVKITLYRKALRASKSSQLAALTSPCLFQPFRSPRYR